VQTIFLVDWFISRYNQALLFLYNFMSVD